LAEKSQIGIQGLLKAKANFRSPIAEEFALEQQLKGEDPKVDEALRNLQEAYGKEYLASISDRELFALYKKHSI